MVLYIYICIVLWRQIKPTYTAHEVCYSYTETKYISAFWGFLKFCPLKTNLFTVKGFSWKTPKTVFRQKIINWTHLALAALQWRYTGTVWCWCIVQSWCDGHVTVQGSLQFCFEKQTKSFRWDTTEATLTFFLPFLRAVWRPGFIASLLWLL